MKAGVIATIEGDFDRLDSYHESTTDRGFDLTTCVDVRRGHIDLPTGDLIAQSGRVLTQSVERVSEVDVEDGEIITSDGHDRISQWTQFIVVPGEFMIVEGGDDTFAFDVVGDLTQTHIERANFDLDEYAETRPEAEPWKYGFYNGAGNAESGTVYGTNVVEDPEMGDVLSQSNKSQLGLELMYESMEMKMEVTNSGYSRVLRPTNFSTENFVHFILNEFWEHRE
ncbi:hypothetical protein [Haloarchaeobius sp. HME9146]|uniref:hypothetical protein n=1 Tax=Haloarchaeobius sp. HME9146 TaxID=2978732 RepID=UPI0021BEC3B6|nr:hypothetical protein [Haloarchaeobius sp. HME9146]MCT9095290.1 hypothetical protein [Haloarchaeobius sp. HME9146]